MSLDSLLPEEDQMNRRMLEQPALNSSLMDRILESSNVRTAKRSVFIDQGWWYLSGILASQNAMTNKWLSEQGLLSIKDLWVKTHYPNKPKLQFAQ